MICIFLSYVILLDDRGEGCRCGQSMKLARDLESQMNRVYICRGRAGGGGGGGGRREEGGR